MPIEMPNGFNEKAGLDFSVREATATDAAAIFLVSEQSFSGAERWSEAMFFSDLTDKTKRYFAAYPEGDPAGVVGFIGAAHILDEAHIMDIAVLSAVRRKGIARKLLDCLLSDASARGVTSATLEVRVSNKPAKSFYEQAGFESAGIRKHYYPDKEDAEIYWKEW